MAKDPLHKPSGSGHGKWQDMSSLKKYVKKRNSKRKAASKARKANR